MNRGMVVACFLHFVFYTITTVTIGSTCYGEGRGIVTSPLQNKMFVISGANGTCIAVMLYRAVSFVKARKGCAEEFVNGGDLVKVENAKHLKEKWAEVTAAFMDVLILVDFPLSDPNSCSVLLLDGSVKEWWSTCKSSFKKYAFQFICQYPFNYDCVFKHLEPMDHWVMYKEVCKFPTSTIWQHSDLDHSKNCSRERFEIVPIEYCSWTIFDNLSDSEWSKWEDSVCSKPCADGGLKQIFSPVMMVDDNNVTLVVNETLTMSCNTHINCPSPSTHPMTTNNATTFPPYTTPLPERIIPTTGTTDSLSILTVIIAACAGVLLLIIVIVVAVCVVKKRKKSVLKFQVRIMKRNKLPPPQPTRSPFTKSKKPVKESKELPKKSKQERKKSVKGETKSSTSEKSETSYTPRHKPFGTSKKAVGTPADQSVAQLSLPPKSILPESTHKKFVQKKANLDTSPPPLSLPPKSLSVNQKASPPGSVFRQKKK